MTEAYIFQGGLVWKWDEAREEYVTADIVCDVQARLCWLQHVGHRA